MARRPLVIKVNGPGDLFQRMSKAVLSASRTALETIANDAHREWINAAGRNLTKTRADYTAALAMRKVNEDTYEISLHHPDKKINWLVTALEVGVPSFNLKPGLLKSDAAYAWSQHAKRAGEKKVGAPFLDVPFKTKPGVKIQKHPNKFRRVSDTSAGWRHPGFKPSGEGGPLTRPLREDVKDHIKKQVPKVFGPIFAKMKL